MVIIQGCIYSQYLSMERISQDGAEELNALLEQKNKAFFITESLKKPVEGHSDHQKWIQVDYMVTSWIMNTITGEISRDFDYVDSSKHLWDDLNERYGQNNGPMYYEIGKDLYNLQQGSMSIAEYYGKMKHLWEELQNIEGIPECVCEVLEKCSCSLLKKFIEAENNRRLI
ncbi:uncharacterized protein LOC141654871 [Silene latifolia]|uniref:uncharacterized protein LOC141654871 n=1 Tax=Silene latifolia TaxID=37657 RepID=UPI003D78AFA7